jgi:hypothetical protein
MDYGTQQSLMMTTMSINTFMYNLLLQQQTAADGKHMKLYVTLIDDNMRIWSASSLFLERLDAEIEKCWIVKPLGCAESESHLRHDDKGETRYAAYLVCCMQHLYAAYAA